MSQRKNNPLSPIEAFTGRFKNTVDHKNKQKRKYRKIYNNNFHMYNIDNCHTRSVFNTIFGRRKHINYCVNFF